MADASPKLSASKLAVVLGVHVNSVKYHALKGMPYTTDRKTGWKMFDEKKCRRWLREHGSVRHNGGNKVGGFAKGKGEPASPEKDDPNSPLKIALRLQLAKIDELETKNAERKGQLVNAQEAESLFASKVAGIRTAFESVPIKAAAGVLAAIEGDHTLHDKIVKAIKVVIDDAMNALAEAAT